MFYMIKVLKAVPIIFRRIQLIEKMSDRIIFIERNISLIGKNNRVMLESISCPPL
jgi:hypothetical protein